MGITTGDLGPQVVWVRLFLFLLFLRMRVFVFFYLVFFMFFVESERCNQVVKSQIIYVCKNDKSLHQVSPFLVPGMM